jgi:hypothetical protein
VADGTALTIDYAKATITAGTYRPRVRRRTSRRRSKGRSASCRTTRRARTGISPCWNASLRPNGDISFISEEFNKFTLEGTAQSDARAPTAARLLAVLHAVPDVVSDGGGLHAGRPGLWLGRHADHLRARRLPHGRAAQAGWIASSTDGDLLGGRAHSGAPRRCWPGCCRKTEAVEPGRRVANAKFFDALTDPERQAAFNAARWPCSSRIFSCRGKLLDSFPDLFNPPAEKRRSDRKKAPPPCADADDLCGEWTDVVATLALRTGQRMSVVATCPVGRADAVPRRAR